MAEHEEYIIERQLDQIYRKLDSNGHWLKKIRESIQWACIWLFWIMIASINSCEYLDDEQTNTAPQQQEDSQDE